VRPSRRALSTRSRAGAKARTETTKLADPDGAPSDTLGFSVAIDAGMIVAGAPFDDVGTHPDQGSASVFFQPLGGPFPPPLSPPPPSPPPPSPHANLVLSELTVSPGRFRTAATLRKRSRPGKRTTIRFTLTSRATVRLSFARATSGRTVAAACQPTRRTNRAKPRCTRYITIGSFSVQARGGSNSIPFTGVLAAKRLAPGSYKLTATATDSAHNTSQPRTAKLTITAK
jgi:FG-GAP repeat